MLFALIVVVGVFVVVVVLFRGVFVVLLLLCPGVNVFFSVVVTDGLVTLGT